MKVVAKKVTAKKVVAKKVVAKRPAAKLTVKVAAKRPAAKLTMKVAAKRPAAKLTMKVDAKRPAAKSTMKVVDMRPAATCVDSDDTHPAKQADIDISTPEMTQLAHEAVNHAKIAQWSELYPLLSGHPGLVNARPEVCEYGVLHQAVWQGDAAVVAKLVMQYGADVNVLTKSGATAADIAKEKGHKDALEALTRRQFKVKTLGGSEVEVVVPADGNITDLEVQVARAMGLGLCFSLVAKKEKLFKTTGGLPVGNDITCIVENPSSLCAAAQNVLKRAPNKWDPKTLKKLADCGLGRCRKLGDFETMQFKNDPYMPDFMKFHFDDDMDIGRYEVIELALIDGAKKCHQLIAVINEGDSDCNSGCWGPVYLRPGFKRVAGLISLPDGMSRSKWKVSDSSWYTDTDENVFPCGNELCGGTEAYTALEQHLAHALSVAKFGHRAMFMYGRSMGW